VAGFNSLLQQQTVGSIELCGNFVLIRLATECRSLPSAQQLQELEQRIENATEVLMQSPNLKDRFIPKIQSDEDKIRKVKTEIETWNLASAPTGVDLDSFRSEIEQALRSDLQIQKPP